MAFFVLVGFLVSSSGCATLKPDEYATRGYTGTPEVKKGKNILALDILGNIFSLLPKLLIWDWKVGRHRITKETEDALNAYLKVHAEELGNVAVQLNRWAPADSMRRLFKNSKVGAPYRYTIGFLAVLLGDVLFFDRVLGGDRYNPFTHTVYLYSDLPTIALHELGHARDFAGRKWRGSYALFRFIPFADLYQEYQASEIAFEYTRDQKLYGLELEGYRILYPAYGTYAGSYFLGIGTITFAIIGHIWGRADAERSIGERRLF